LGKLSKVKGGTAREKVQRKEAAAATYVFKRVFWGDRGLGDETESKHWHKHVCNEEEPCSTDLQHWLVLQRGVAETGYVQEGDLIRALLIVACGQLHWLAEVADLAIACFLAHVIP